MVKLGYTFASDTPRPILTSKQTDVVWTLLAEFDICGDEGLRGVEIPFVAGEVYAYGKSAEMLRAALEDK